jgi:uncharacterized protein (TIGR02246 family)
MPTLTRPLRHLRAVLALLCASTTVASAQAPTDDARATVLALVEQSARDWNRGDLDAFCAVYAEDAVFISPTGVTRGRQAVLERYRTRYTGPSGMGTLSFDILDVRVSPGTASGPSAALGAGASGTAVSVVARWHLGYTDKPEASGLTLIVWHRTTEGWRLVQDASM